MTIKALLKELHDRLHAQFAATEEKDPNGQVTTTRDTRLTDEATDADGQEIVSSVAKHVADIQADA